MERVERAESKLAVPAKYHHFHLSDGALPSENTIVHMPPKQRMGATRLAKKPLKLDGKRLLQENFDQISYELAVPLLDTRIKRLTEVRNVSWKKKIVANVCRPCFLATGLASFVYNALINVGWDSENPLVHLATVVTMVAMCIICGVTLLSGHCYRRSAQIAQANERDLYENEKLKRFFVLAIAFCQDPRPENFEVLQKMYLEMPPEIQDLYAKTWEAVLEASKEERHLKITLDDSASQTPFSAFPRQESEEEMKVSITPATPTATGEMASQVRPENLATIVEAGQETPKSVTRNVLTDGETPLGAQAGEAQAGVVTEKTTAFQEGAEVRPLSILDLMRQTSQTSTKSA